MTGAEFVLATLGFVHVARVFIERAVAVGTWLDERRTDRLAR